MERILVSLFTLSALSVSLASAQPSGPPSPPALAAIHGAGTPGSIPAFTSPTYIADSQIFQVDGDFTGPWGTKALLGIGTQNPQATLHINYGDTGNVNSFMLGNCDIDRPGPDGPGRCLFIADGGGALDIVSGLSLFMHAPDLVINPEGAGDHYPVRGYVGIGTTDITHILTIKALRGPAIADGWTSYSSKRGKTNIQPLDGALDKVSRLKGVSFDWKGTGKHDIGLVAEEVANVVPELVTFEKDGKEVRSVDYGRLTALLVEAIKAQQSEIDELKTRLLAQGREK